MGESLEMSDADPRWDPANVGRRLFGQGALTNQQHPGVSAWVYYPFAGTEAVAVWGTGSTES